MGETQHRYVTRCADADISLPWSTTPATERPAEITSLGLCAAAGGVRAIPMPSATDVKKETLATGESRVVFRLHFLQPSWQSSLSDEAVLCIEASAPTAVRDDS